MDEYLGPLAGLVALLVLSGFFSGSETALMAVSRYRLRHLEREGDPNARLVRELTASPDRLLSAILLGNNFVNIAASVLATTIAIDLVGEQNGVLVATFVMTALILVFSEIVPKTLAARFPERVALRIARPVRGVVMLLGPLARAAAWLSSTLLAPVVGRAGQQP